MNKYIIILFLVSIGYTQQPSDTLFYHGPIEYTSITFCNPIHTSKDTIKWKLDSDFIFFIDLETKELYSVKEIKYCVQDTMLIFVKRGKKMEAKILSGTIIENLIRLAKRDMWTDSEEFNPMDQSGGNYDDAYWAGSIDGQISLAQDILNQLNIDYKGK